MQKYYNSSSHQYQPYGETSRSNHCTTDVLRYWKGMDSDDYPPTIYNLPHFAILWYCKQIHSFVVPVEFILARERNIRSLVLNYLSLSSYLHTPNKYLPTYLLTVPGCKVLVQSTLSKLEFVNLPLSIRMRSTMLSPP